MKTRLHILAACAALAALAGCGGGPVANPHPTGAVANDATNAPSFDYPRSRVVTIGGGGLSPQRVRVWVNTTIHWVNRDTKPHSLRWTGGRTTHFDAARLAPGQTFSIRMPHVDTVTYRASGGFRGVIEVG